MEAHGGTQVLGTPVRHPSSPPVTPDSGDPFRTPRSRTTHTWKRHGFVGSFHFSPSSEDGQNIDRSIRASTPELLNVPRSPSRPSTSSGVDDSPRRGRAISDADTQSEASYAHSSVIYRYHEEFELIIEELRPDDPRSLKSSGLLRPDAISEAGSERPNSSLERTEDDVLKRIEELYCDEDDDNEEAKRHYLNQWLRRKKRWSSTRSKRTYSESRGSDVDTDDAASMNMDDGHNAHPSKRRRSVLQHRSSLVFNDPPLEHMTEVDEPDDEAVWIDDPPPYHEVDWADLGLRSLPFCILPDSESDCTSSGDESDDL